ncbi:MAG: hypothetical protein AB1512_10430 [Thermodesulfobacteriota bacterium]
MSKRFFLAVLSLLILAFIRIGTVQAASEILALTLPQLDWAMKIKASGFAMEQRRTNPGGESGYFMAGNKKTGFIISGHIEKVGRNGTPKEAREHFWANLVKAPVKRGEVTMAESGNLATVEYMVRDFQGMLINQKNLYAFMTRDHYWMYLHLSKMNFHQADESFLRSILENVSIETKNPSGKIETTYRLSGKDHYFTLYVPEAWTDEIKRPKGDLPPTLEFHPGGVPASAVHITPVWSPQEDPSFNSPERIRKLVEEAGKALLAEALEKELAIREIKGKSVSGLYFGLTDKKPDLPTGEFKYMIQGACAVGDLLVTFTIFTQSQDSDVIKTALEMIADAGL